MYDLKIVGGGVVDGSGAPPCECEVAIEGGRIAEVASGVGLAREVIDAEGLLVAPGFIDSHSHACGDGVGSVLHTPTADSAVLQGVTTIVAGMCGYSPIQTGVHYDKVAATGCAVNFALLIGHNSVRRHVMEQRAGAPTAGEMRRMRSLVRSAMEQGALGLSSGLWYVPGAYAKTEELIELAREVRPYGGLYATHVRGENAETGLEALGEAIAIGFEAGVPVQVAHLKAAERPAWGQAKMRLERLERAYAQGLNIHADAYPYAASATGLEVCLPPEAFEGDGLTPRLTDAQRLRRYYEHIRIRLERLGGPQSVLITAARRSDVAGKRLDEAAKIMGLSPEEAILNLIVAGQTSAIYFSMDQDDVDQVLVHPLVMIGSDSGVRRPGEGMCHPRTWGTFPRMLARYVRELGRLSWAEAILKMTSQPAAKFRLRDRGIIRQGAWADLVLLDPRTIRDEATYEDPHAAPTGIRAVLVNGQRVVEDGKITGELPGHVIRGVDYPSPIGVRPDPPRSGYPACHKGPSAVGP